MAAWDMWTVLGLLMSMGLCALANEQTSNSIIIRIYQLSIDKWNGGIKDDFALAVTDQANSYCADNLAKCGLNTHSIMFAPENVVHNDGSPNYKKPYLTVEFALTYPSGADTTNASTVDHVPRNALQALTIGAMDSFEDRTGYHIVDVGDEEFSIPPNTTLNIALCVVAVVLLLAVLVTCQVLNWKCGKSNNDEDDDQDLEKGKSSGSGKSDDVAMETRSLVETNSDAGTPETGPPEAISKDDVSKGDASASAPLELTSMETVKTKPDATNGAEYSAVNT